MSQPTPNSDKRKILIQLDSDAQPSSFDRVVAIDAGVDELFSYGGVTPEQIEALVHGAIFTRGVPDLKSTAIFIGGSDVAKGEAMLKKVVKTFFGPMRVSVMMDANGSNTTAAAAVAAARKHVDLAQSHAVVLAGTGPVGQRAARMLAREGASVILGSRDAARAQHAADAVNAATGSSKVTGRATGDEASVAAALDDATIVIAAGAAGVRLLSAHARQAAKKLRVAIDLNAVPPPGLEGVEVMDKAKERDGVICYGTIGVGGAKMKTHKAALASLFTANDKVLDAEEIYAIAKSL